jgi:hypothetical protein
MSRQVIEGVVNFSHVTKHDVFKGKDTGFFSMTITMSEDDAATLASQGVKISEYKGKKQRKFKSIYTINMYNSEGDRFEGEVPFNSRVRLKYTTGPAHPVHGTPTYLVAVKVLELAEVSEEAVDF